MNPPPPSVGDNGVSNQSPLLKSHAKFFSQFWHSSRTLPISPPTDPAHSAGQTQNQRRAPTWRPSRRFLRFEADFLRIIHQKSVSSKSLTESSRNRSLAALGSPWDALLSFWHKLWYHFGLYLLFVFIFCAKGENHENAIKTICFLMTLAFQSL